MFKINRKAAAIAISLLTIGAIAYFCHYTGLFENCTAEGIKQYVNSFGVLGPLVYMVMFCVIPAGSVIALAGGMAFGVYFGTLYTTLGAILGATSAFYISRLLGRDAVEKLTRGKIQSFEDGVEKKGFILILILRLIPIVPFNVISYGAGLTKIKFYDYMMATMVGIIPGVIVFTNLGDKALNIKSPEFILAIAMLVILTAGSYFFKKKIEIKGLKSEAISSDGA
jgi:uncharacterized membrane protein YdjX (TVP38/TMEM64 family)